MQCTRCRKQHAGFTKYCEDCLIYFRELRKKRVIDKRCTKCGAPLNPDIDTGKCLCMNCRQWRTI